jgi:hypothetical protein
MSDMNKLSVDVLAVNESADFADHDVARASQKVFIPAAIGKVGATAGFVTGGANNAMVTCPAEQTASTFVIPVLGLKPGFTITGFHLNGQIESAGGAVTVDADLRKITVVASGSTHASVGAMAQLAVTADTAMGVSNTAKGGLSEVVASGETFYVLVTATTAASTDIELNGIAVIVSEV